MVMVAIGRFPRLYAAASLKRELRVRLGELDESRFPRLYAAASLKRVAPAPQQSDSPQRFPRLYAAASLKPRERRGLGEPVPAFSAALCRGLIEATAHD